MSISPIRVAAVIVVTTATLAYALTGVVSAPAHAMQHSGTENSIGIQLLDIPANNQNDPRAHSYIIDALAPGTTIQRRIEVSNTTSTPVKINLYAAAAQITNGSFLGKPGHTPNDLSSWISLAQGNLEIPSHSETVDTVTIAIPADAAPGEQYATVWAEVSDTSSSEIKLVNRVGIRVYLDVTGNNPPATDFTIETFTAQRDHEDKPIVLATVKNTGGRAIDLSGALTLTALKGSVTAGPYPTQLGTTLAPGQSEPIRIAPPDTLVDGPWNATLTLHSGLKEVTATAKITFPHHPGTTSAVRIQTPLINLTIIMLIIGLIVIVAISLTFIYTKHRQQRIINK